MKMHLKGSCHCKAVTFSVESEAPYPFNRCYCEVCRKTAGAGGYAINIGADFETLLVRGEEHIRIYRPNVSDESKAERSFCGQCGSALWLWDPRWPAQVHPHASAIDTPLPVPPKHWHMMLLSSANWMEPEIKPGDAQFETYPSESLATWHARLSLMNS